MTKDTLVRRPGTQRCPCSSGRHTCFLTRHGTGPWLSPDSGTAPSRLLPGLSPPSPLPMPSCRPSPGPSASCLSCRELPRPALRPKRGRLSRLNRPCPQKNRNLLDLWQTIAQDLSRLFAVPGCCPSRPEIPEGPPAVRPAFAAAVRWRHGEERPWSCLRPKPRAHGRMPSPQAFGKRVSLSGRNGLPVPPQTWRRCAGSTHPPSNTPLHGTRGAGREGCPARRDTVPRSEEKIWARAVESPEREG